MMMTLRGMFLVACLYLWTGTNVSFAQPVQSGSSFKTVLVFFDGLRPDYIRPEIMPHLYELSVKGTHNKDHHSIFPTFTRVNAAAYATGSYPGTNGLLGNEVYFPEIDPAKSLNTANADVLEKLMAATKGNLLNTPSFGELLQGAGERLMGYSNGSVGQAFFQNHKISGGGIVHPEYIMPVSLKESLLPAIGAIPAFEELNRPRHRWITDALLHYLFSDDAPLVSAIWYTDPDETTHVKGIGSDHSLEALKIVDEQLGRILEAIRSRQQEDNINIIVSSDHGFITLEGKTEAEDLLIEQGLKQSKTSDDVVLADGAIYVKDHNPELVTRIVRLLQQQHWIGPLFTRGKPGSDQGWVEGTLSFASIHWDHPLRSADILISPNWDHKKNDKGYPGNSYFKGWTGSHGGISPYEINISLILSGPSFKKKYTGTLPSSNVDIVPTVLHLYRIATPESMDGRVLHELLAGDSAKTRQKPRKQTVESSFTQGGKKYTARLQRTVLGKYRYVDFGSAERK